MFKKIQYLEKLHRQAKHIVVYSYRSLGLYYFVTDFAIDTQFLTGSAPLGVLHPLFKKFVQLTIIDGAEFGTEAPPGGIISY